MPGRYRLTLFGGFGLERPDGTPVALATRKTRLLLAYLALNPGRAHPRETLATLLWGEHGEAQARGSLRQSLAALRRSLAPALAADRDTVCLLADALEVDALDFDRLAEGGAAELAAAAALAVGPLLEGLGGGSAELEAWLRTERDLRRTRLAGVLRRLLALQEGGGATMAALATVERLLALDPLDEAAHRAAMRLHAGRGEWGRGLERFAVCRGLLQTELGVAPEPATLALRDLLLRREAPAAAPPERVPAAPPAEPPADRPTLAVLRFAELGGDHGERWFADGITADIITELSRFRTVTVIAAGTASAGSGGADLPGIGRALGVRYLLEGSIRRDAGRIRMAVRLVEAATGRHVWAERYDRPEGDVFALQDELARHIVTAASQRVAEAELAAARRKPPRDLRAYELFLRGNAISDSMTAAAQAEALAFFEQARQADPDYARAYTGIAAIHAMRPMVAGMGRPAGPDLDAALAAARAALARDPDDARVHYMLAWVHLLRQEFEPSRRACEMALRLNPNDPTILIHGAWNRAAGGDLEGALELAEAALRLSPMHPEWYHFYVGRIHYLRRRHDLAAAHIEALTEPGPRYLAWQAANRGQRGEAAAARAAGQAFLEAVRTGWRGAPVGDEGLVAWLVGSTPLRRTEDRDYFREGLRRAGLPA
jgi:TolB-like protein/DNA-binding SARP family transcriptional activator